jgi:glycolate oxidase FAD binding subunit
MVAAGLSGPARASAGAVRDHILGMRLMDASGQVLTFGGQVMKNVAGFDVSRMMAGALGVFGLILEVSFKVLPQPVAVRTLVFESDAAEALARLNAWGGQPLPVSASAWSGGLLRIRLAGASLAVQAAAARLGGETLGPAEAQCYWQDVREHADAFFAGPLPLWRLSVPSVAPAAVLDGPQLIEWGGALRWVRTEAGAPRLRAAAVAAGGHATLFRGGDKASGVFQPLSPALAAIHRRLKAQLDPQRIFNRGRMYPDL